MSLLTELDAFFTDHHDCGDLEAGVDGPMVWIACPCGPAWRGGRTRTTMPGAVKLSPPAKEKP